MAQILQFPQKKEPEKVVSIETARTEAKSGESMSVKTMVEHSAAMQVISTLAFYAKQGYDGGAKARRALEAMQEIMRGQVAPT